MSLLVTIIKARQSVGIGMLCGLIAAQLGWHISERETSNVVKFAPLATLRLVITPQEIAKPTPLSGVSSPTGSVLGEPTPKQTADLRTAKTSESPAAHVPTAKTSNNSKCFDDLSLGDDDPGAKERTRKPKC
jgi:hypothetical protein